MPRIRILLFPLLLGYSPLAKAQDEIVAEQVKIVAEKEAEREATILEGERLISNAFKILIPTLTSIYIVNRAIQSFVPGYWLLPSFLTVNTGVYLYAQYDQDFVLNNLALTKEKSLKEQLLRTPWKVLTPAMTHIYSLHFLANMAILCDMFPIEKKMSYRDLLSLMVGGALSGNMAAYIAQDRPAIGASTLLSSLLAHIERKSGLSDPELVGTMMARSIFEILINFVLTGDPMRPISLPGHFGGWLFGFFYR